MLFSAANTNSGLWSCTYVSIPQSTNVYVSTTASTKCIYVNI